jgi:hypothetical protein
LILQTGDTLGTDTTGVKTDTAEVLHIYDIPEIIQYDNSGNNLRPVSSQYNSITPRLHDIALRDAFFYTPFTVIDRGPAQPAELIGIGFDTEHTTFFLNNHVLNDPLSGTLNLSLVPIQFLRSIQTGLNEYGQPNITLSGKENMYERPYSTTGFMTGSYGHTAYIFELTRAIDNASGFYMDGLYREFGGYRSNDAFTSLAMYTSVYDNHVVPMRADAIIASNTFGYPDQVPDTVSTADQRLIDISYCTGFPDHRIYGFYCDHMTEWHDSLNQRSVTQKVHTLGLGSDNTHTLGPLQLSYKISGLRTVITSDVYGTHSFYTLNAAQSLHLLHRGFFLSLSVEESYGDDTFLYTPHVSAGYLFTDAVAAYVSAARRHRQPLISETAVLLDTLPNAVGTNDTLRTEYFWQQEAGLHSDYGSLGFFRYDFTDRIITGRDSIDRPVYTNHTSWQTAGTHGTATLPLYLQRDDETDTYTRCVFGVYGSYLFNEDTLGIIPRNTIKGMASFARNTQRFGITLAAYGNYVGSRYAFMQGPQDHYTTFGCYATIRFITLSLSARVDNLLDTDHAFYPGYPLMGRSFVVNVRWQFWY